MGELSEKKLPEYLVNAQAKQSLAEFTPREMMSQVGSQLRSSPEMASLNRAATLNKPYAGLSTSTTENILDRYIRGGASIEDGKTLETLNKAVPGLLESLDKLRLSKNFSGPRTNGSRNVQWGAITGGGVGGALFGYPGALAGGSAGASFGRFLDTDGPAMTKSVLDKYLGAVSSPRVQQLGRVIEQADKEIPPYAIMQTLTRQKPKYVAGQNASEFVEEKDAADQYSKRRYQWKACCDTTSIVQKKDSTKLTRSYRR